MATADPAAAGLVSPAAATAMNQEGQEDQEGQEGQGIATERPGHGVVAPAAAPTTTTEAPATAPRTNTYAEVAVKPEYLRVRPTPAAANGNAGGPRTPKRSHGDAGADGFTDAAAADEALEAAVNNADAVRTALGCWPGALGVGSIRQSFSVLMLVSRQRPATVSACAVRTRTGRPATSATA